MDELMKKQQDFNRLTSYIEFAMTLMDTKIRKEFTDMILYRKCNIDFTVNELNDLIKLNK